jgi:predicted nucleotidyltransferase
MAAPAYLRMLANLEPAGIRNRLGDQSRTREGDLPAMAAETRTIDARALTERARVLRILREHEAELRAQGVTRLRLFSSMARGDALPDSDVDLIAEIDRTMSFSLLDLVGLQDRLRDLLGR